MFSETLGILIENRNGVDENVDYAPQLSHILSGKATVSVMKGSQISSQIIGGNDFSRPFTSSLQNSRNVQRNVSNWRHFAADKVDVVTQIRPGGVRRLDRLIISWKQRDKCQSDNPGIPS